MAWARPTCAGSRCAVCQSLGQCTAMTHRWGGTPVLRPASTPAYSRSDVARRAGPGGPAQTWRSAPRFALVLLFAASGGAQSKLTMFPPVRGLHEMVGSCNNFEVDAGMRILAEGGNAVDAGVATTLAAGVTELDHFGLGGEIPILIKLAGKPVIAISGIGTAPKRATVAFYASR